MLKPSMKTGPEMSNDSLKCVTLAITVWGDFEKNSKELYFVVIGTAWHFWLFGLN